MMKSSPATQRLQELLPRLFEKQQQIGQRYLLFQITPEIKAAINLERVWEVNHLSSTAITPIPQMPPWVLGWSNGSDRVFCIISLAELLGFSTSSQMSRQYPLVVVQIPNAETFQVNLEKKYLLLGLTVNQIQGTVPISSEQIVSPVGEFPEEITPYLEGTIKQNEEHIAVLNLDQISEKLKLAE